MSVENNPIIRYDSTHDIQDDALSGCVSILSKEGYLRTEEELQILENIFSGMPWISKIHPQNHDELIMLLRDLNYEHFDAGEVVFEQGSMGTKFYIILAGAVEVFVKTGATKSHDIKVNELMTGQAFGELAIMDSKLKPRTATISCKEETHMATLSREAFKTLGGRAKEAIMKNIEALGSNILFKLGIWSDRQLQQWSRSFHIRPPVKKYSIIYKEGDPADTIYFLRSGEVLSTRKRAIAHKDSLKNEYVLDKNFHLSHQPKDDLLTHDQICLWTTYSLFGDEETIDKFKHEIFFEEAKHKYKNELKIRLAKEREVIEKSKHLGVKYTPNKDFEVPDDPKKDYAYIERLVKLKFPSTIVPETFRETTVTVISAEAEIWSMSSKLFFSQFYANFQAWKEINEVISTKKARRMQRLRELDRSTKRNSELLSSQTLSFKRKHFKQDPDREIIYPNESLTKLLNQSHDPPSSQSPTPTLKSPRLDATPELKPRIESNSTLPSIPRRAISNSVNVSTFKLDDSGLLDRRKLTNPIRRSRLEVLTSVKKKRNLSGFDEDLMSPVLKVNQSFDAAALNQRIESKKSFVLIDNPIRGMNKISNFPSYIEEIDKRNIETGVRVSNKDDIPDKADLRASQFFRDRIETKLAQRDKLNMKNPTGKYVPLFSRNDIKVSEDNFHEIYLNKPLRKQPVRKVRFAPKVPPLKKPLLTDSPDIKLQEISPLNSKDESQLTTPREIRERMSGKKSNRSQDSHRFSYPCYQSPNKSAILEQTFEESCGETFGLHNEIRDIFERRSTRLRGDEYERIDMFNTHSTLFNNAAITPKMDPFLYVEEPFYNMHTAQMKKEKNGSKKSMGLPMPAPIVEETDEKKARDVSNKIANMLIGDSNLAVAPKASNKLHRKNLNVKRDYMDVPQNLSMSYDRYLARKKVGYVLKGIKKPIKRYLDPEERRNNW